MADLIAAVSCWSMAIGLLWLWWRKRRVSDWHKSLAAVAFVMFLSLAGLRLIAQHLAKHETRAVWGFSAVSAGTAILFWTEFIPWAMKLPTSVEWRQKAELLSRQGLEITELRIREKQAHRQAVEAIVREARSLIAADATNPLRDVIRKLDALSKEA